MTLIADIAATSAQVAATASRREKAVALAARLSALGPEELAPGALFLAGIPGNRPLRVGYAALRSVQASAPAAAPTLTVTELADRLADIATIAGAGAARERTRRLGELFTSVTRAEQEWLAGLIGGELRQGALEGLIQEAIALAAALPLALVRRAVMLTGDPGGVARAALLEGRPALERLGIRLFRPILPMLAQPAEDVSDALGRLGAAALEWKIDGARIQVHKQGDEVRVYTRNLNDVTAFVPEIGATVARSSARELVLDGEAIVRSIDGTPAPFQVTMRRFGRRRSGDPPAGQLPLSPFFFDCLHVDGDSLLDRPATERFEALSATMPADTLIPRLLTDDIDVARDFLQAAIGEGHEGLMAKAPGAAYEAGARGAGWLKIKRVHTLDLVVLAAEWGNGRRRGWLSNLHLGARAPDGGFVMLGKTFKGMTDDVLTWQTRELLARETGRDGNTVHVRPELVVEIAFNDLQESPHYPGGLALRFARLRRYRPDRTAADADTIDTVRGLYAAGREGWERATRAAPGTVRLAGDPTA